jgi:hypothetical protein
VTSALRFKPATKFLQIDGDMPAKAAVNGLRH